MRGKLQYIFSVAFFALFFLWPAGAACETSRKADSLYKTAQRYRRALLDSEKKKKYAHNWQNCIRRFEKVHKKYPKSDKAPWALYHSARLFTGFHRYSGSSKYLDEAIGLYRRIIAQYENHRLADDAQYLIGEIFYEHKKDSTQAYVEFLKVDVKFPGGDMRPKAKKMLDKLALVLSEKEKAKASSLTTRPGSKPGTATDIRHWSTPNYTRVVIDLDSSVKYEHHLLEADPDLKKPRRLYLDLKNARVSSQIDSALSIKDGLLQRARAGQYKKDTVRVVLDMESIGEYKVFHLYDPFRIVVDVRKLEEKAARAETRPAQAKRAPSKEKKRAKDSTGKLSIATQLGLNVKKIVIDPGHGGKDPGCLVDGKIREKDIVLKMAKLLAKRIKKDIGCEVVLTREKDVFLSLEQRTAIANMEKADLFVSLHINAHKSSKVWGLETYFLNIATDEDAVMVAARENATSTKNISDLQGILNALMLNTKIHESSRLAQMVQRGIVSRLNAKYDRVKDLGVKKAPFYVLVGAQMPAILVEAGFLSNYMEKKRLLSESYRHTMAEGISKGINAYIGSIDKVYQGG